MTQQLLSAVLYSSQFAPRSHDPLGVLLPFLHSLGRVRAHEIRLFADDGTLVYTSPPPLYKAGRAAPDWFSHLVSPALPDAVLNVNFGHIAVRPEALRAILMRDDMKNLIGLAWVFAARQCCCVLAVGSR